MLLFGIRISIEAINSIMPDPILPTGSISNLENSVTLSGAAVNLKNKVCSIMNAGIIRINQKYTFFIVYFLGMNFIETEFVQKRWPVVSFGPSSKI
jgi:hypothetical protein